MAVDEGRLELDAPLTRYFPKAPLLGSVRTKGITVDDLYSMRVAVAFNETGSVTDNEWQRAYLESSFRDRGVFAYNSMNSFMLAALLGSIWGEPMGAVLARRLYKPLGFGPVIWEKSPDGVEKGGFGLYLLPEDMLKLGVLYMRYGDWFGERSYQEVRARRAVGQDKGPPETSAFFDYGGHVWVGKTRDNWLLNAMFGARRGGCPMGVLSSDSHRATTPTCSRTTRSSISRAGSSPTIKSAKRSPRTRSRTAGSYRCAARCPRSPPKCRRSRRLYPRRLRHRHRNRHRAAARCRSRPTKNPTERRCR